MGVNYACNVTYACACSSLEQRKPGAIVQSQNVGVAPMQASVEGKAHEQHAREATHRGLFDASPRLDVLPKTPCSPRLLTKKEAPRPPLQLLPAALPHPPEPPQSPQTALPHEPRSRRAAAEEERPGPPRPPEAQALPRSPRARLRSVERELLSPLLSAEEDAALRAEVESLRGQLASAGQARVTTGAAGVEEHGSWLQSLVGSCAAMSVVSQPASHTPFVDMCVVPDDACNQPDLQEPDKVILQEDASWLRCRREQLASEYRLLPDVCRSEVETAVGASLIGPHLMPRTLVPQRSW